MILMHDKKFNKNVGSNYFEKQLATFHILGRCHVDMKHACRRFKKVQVSLKAKCDNIQTTCRNVKLYNFDPRELLYVFQFLSEYY